MIYCDKLQSNHCSLLKPQSVNFCNGCSIPRVAWLPAPDQMYNLFGRNLPETSFVKMSISSETYSYNGIYRKSTYNDEVKFISNDGKEILATSNGWRTVINGTQLTVPYDTPIFVKDQYLIVLSIEKECMHNYSVSIINNGMKINLFYVACRRWSDMRGSVNVSFDGKMWYVEYPIYDKSNLPWIKIKGSTKIINGDMSGVDTETIKIISSKRRQ